MLRARCAPSAHLATPRSLPRQPIHVSAISASASRRCALSCSYRIAPSILSRAFSNKPRRIFQVAGIPDPKVVAGTNDFSKVAQEVEVYYSTKDKKYIRYFFVGACVQMLFTSIGAHMLYQSYEFQKDAPTLLTQFSQEGMLMLCGGFICIGLACFYLVRHNARRRITSITLLPGGKRLRLTSFTMLGGVSKPFEIDVEDIVRGHWTTRDDGKEVPGFFIKGKRWGYALDPEARINSLPMLKAIIKHPMNVGSK